MKKGCKMTNSQCIYCTEYLNGWCSELNTNKDLDYIKCTNKIYTLTKSVKTKPVNEVDNVINEIELLITRLKKIREQI